MSLFRVEVDLPAPTSEATLTHLAATLEHQHCKHVPDHAGPALGMPGRSIFFLQSTETHPNLQRSFEALVHNEVSRDAKIFVKQIPEEDEG